MGKNWKKSVRARRSHSGRKRSRVGMRLENLESRELLAADAFLVQNPDIAEDVNVDGVVSPLDGLEIVNALELQNREAADLTGSGQGGEQRPRRMFDVNGDGNLSPIDALMIMNRLNWRNGRATPPPGGGPGDPPTGNRHDEFRSFDGSGNNLRNEEWGNSDTALLRATTPEYDDGVSEPAGADRPSAREISNAVAAQSESSENERGLSDLTWLWGQFIDHDIDLTESGDESFDIQVPTGDPWFDPFGTGEVTIGLSRSQFVDDTGTDLSNPRQQVNDITAYLDGSVVYGSDQDRADALREFSGGRLLTSEGGLLPFNSDGLDNAGGPDASLFLAGDVRANENAALSSMHTLWVREHNRIADRMASENPGLSDEQIYQRAREIVVGELQAITYNEFLPALLGRSAIPRYDGYDPAANVGINNVFSTAAYRFGHSMLSSELLRLNPDGSAFDGGNLPLQEAFFSPNEVTEHGIEPLLMGAANQVAQEIDNQIVDDVRNFLFGPPGAGGLDLASLNIQRGRDHGLADYNQTRIDMGLEPAESFADITSNVALQQELESLYGSVDNIDVWVGGLAEDHLLGSSVGELIHTILVDQFTRIRDGDFYWYQNNFSGQQLRRIDSTTLADVIERNTTIDELQPNVFFVGRDTTPLSTTVTTNDVKFRPPPGRNGQSETRSGVRELPAAAEVDSDSANRNQDRDRGRLNDAVFAAVFSGESGEEVTGKVA